MEMCPVLNKFPISVFGGDVPCPTRGGSGAGSLGVAQQLTGGGGVMFASVIILVIWFYWITV